MRIDRHRPDDKDRMNSHPNPAPTGQVDIFRDTAGPAIGQFYGPTTRRLCPKQLLRELYPARIGRPVAETRVGRPVSTWVVFRQATQFMNRIRGRDL